MPDWREREATNETIFRQMNEWTEVADDGPSSHERIDIYLCECSDRRCSDPIGMTRAQYEAVRAVPYGSRSTWITRIPKSIEC